MCTGQAPFRGSTTLSVLKRLCEETPLSIRNANRDVPECLIAIITRLHAKDPAKRFQSAREVADLLGRQLAEVQQPAALAAANPQATRRSPGKHRWGLAAAVILLLLLAGVLTEATGFTQIAVAVIRIAVGEGTLIVEANDPGVKVTVEGDGGLSITGAGPQEIRLRPGSYHLRANKDGQPLQPDRELVSIARGAKEVVRIHWESASAPARAATPDRPAGAVSAVEASFRDAASQRPQDAEAHFALAEYLEKQKNY